MDLKMKSWYRTHIAWRLLSTTAHERVYLVRADLYAINRRSKEIAMEKAIEAGLCVLCKKRKADSGLKSCAPCQKQQRVYQAKKRRKNGIRKRRIRKARPTNQPTEGMRP